jgi:hypothetical protein
MVLKAFRERKAARAAKEVQGQLNAVTDPATAMELLKKLQGQQVGTQA